MQYLEVGALRLIARLDQRLIARLDEGAHTAAQHRLLAEEISLGLLLEGRFQHTGARAADALEVAEAQRVRLARRVLVNGDEAGHAAALHEDLTDAMAGCFGRGHAHVNARCRHNGLVMNVEAVREEQHLADGQIGPDLFGI